MKEKTSSSDHGSRQSSGVLILLLGNLSAICGSRSDVRDETNVKISTKAGSYLSNHRKTFDPSRERSLFELFGHKKYPTKFSFQGLLRQFQNSGGPCLV